MVAYFERRLSAWRETVLKLCAFKAVSAYAWPICCFDRSICPATCFHASSYACSAALALRKAGRSIAAAAEEYTLWRPSMHVLARSRKGVCAFKYAVEARL